MVGVVCVSDKDVTLTARVSNTTKQQLPDHVNKSSLMRELVQNYVRAGDSVEVSLERRKKDIESELNNLKLQRQEIENEIASKERELDSIQEKLKNRREQAPEAVITFADRITNDIFQRDQLEPDNPAVQTWANKAGLEPERFISEVEERL